MRPSLLGDPRFVLAAAADPRPEARTRFMRETGGRAHAHAAGLCADPEVDAVYVASPHQHHAEQVCLVASRGRPVLVEKPMALTLYECAAMIEAASRAGVPIVVGHSHSFDAPARRARALIEGGALGAVRMIQALNYTDFLYRPRRPEELDTARGGGAVFNQAPHQVDVARLLGGGLVRSVRAHLGAWDRARPTEGAYAALLGFECGAFASLTYSGYAHFDSDAWCGWIGEDGRRKQPALGAARAARRAAGDAAGERVLRLRRADRDPPDDPPVAHEHFGPVIVSCDHADLRLLPDRVEIHADAACRIEMLPPPDLPRGAVLDAFHAAIHGAPVVQSGVWGMATLEVCLAILQSGREGREITLAHQIGVAAP